MRRILIISAAILSVVSCGNKQEETRDTIRLVSDISQGSGREHKILSGYKTDVANGTIAIIDEPARAIKLSKVFAVSDKVDNVTAAPYKDGLPDFAGEHIACFRDNANEGYSQYVSDKNFILLREITLCNAIHAMDTAYFVRAFSDIASIHRDGAKVIVLSSPYAAAYGMHDINRLMERTACPIPVIFPAAEVVKKAVADQRKNVAVICSEEAASQGIYSAVFSEFVPAEKVPFTVCYTPEGAKKDIVKGLLDRYIASGNRNKIDAIIIDDLALETADEVAKAIMIIRADKTEENHRYGKLLDSGLKIYSTAGEAVDFTIREMRQKNIFSHKIAKPEISEYSTVLSEDVTEKSGRKSALGSYTIYEYVQNQR